MIRLDISHIAIYPIVSRNLSNPQARKPQTSKSICGNLNNRLKNGGSRSVDRESGRTPFRGVEVGGRDSGGEVRGAYMLQLCISVRSERRSIY